LSLDKLLRQLARHRGRRVEPSRAKGTKTAPGKTTTKLLVAMTGKASAAKAAEGDEPERAGYARRIRFFFGTARRRDVFSPDATTLSAPTASRM
jgi:hypothetical protein